MKRPVLILQAFRQPESLVSLSLPQWDLLIRQARQATLLATLEARLRQHGLIEQVPAQPREHLEWARLQAERHRQAVHWEVGRIRLALESLGEPLILLKGAAYVLADLPPSHGRLFSDVDILVPKDRLDDVESLLMLHGWSTTHHDAYDQHYYREWMHELPPMQHLKRQTYIDVHHAILPETARIRPDPAKLRAAAEPVAKDVSVRVLAPADMVLHSAVHLFHDGETDKALRDLIDIDALLRHFGRNAAFWPALLSRARELALSRPLFYALRYATELLHAPVPPDVLEAAASAGRPNAPLRMLMDGLYRRALLPDHSSCRDGLSHGARFALYLRGNWLRMPPVLLARHLFHKAFLSPKEPA